MDSFFGPLSGVVLVMVCGRSWWCLNGGDLAPLLGDAGRCLASDDAGDGAVSWRAAQLLDAKLPLVNGVVQLPALCLHTSAALPGRNRMPIN